MLITSKGQITIPKAFRDQLGLLPHTHVTFEMADGELRLKKAVTAPSRGRTLIETMRGKGTVSLSTDEIMRLTREDECPS
jgi:AbrB family looped-hinge helix DNA binding protein